MVGRTYSFTLNARGEITEFTGFRQNTTNVPVARPGKRWLVTTVIDRDGWQELSSARSSSHRQPGWRILAPARESQLESVGSLARDHDAHPAWARRLRHPL